MALITKQVLVCNKCGKEVENGTSNVTILGEEFYFCEDCLEKLIRWATTKSEVRDEPVVESKPVPEIKQVEKPTEYVHPDGRPTTYVQWDEYNLNKLLDLWGQNLTMKQCATSFKTGWGSIAKMLTRIRQATPGTTLYPYQARLNRLDTMRRNPKKEGDD